MSKITAIPSSPSGKTISIWWTGCPNSLARLSMCSLRDEVHASGTATCCSMSSGGTKRASTPCFGPARHRLVYLRSHHSGRAAGCEPGGARGAAHRKRPRSERDAVAAITITARASCIVTARAPCTPPRHGTRPRASRCSAARARAQARRLRSPRRASRLRRTSHRSAC